MGSIPIPPSKSHTLRAILFGLMGEGTSHIKNYLNSPDTWAMVEAIRLLGAKVEVKSEKMIVEGVAGVLRPAENVIDAGNSGLVLRLVGALAGLSPSYTVITGDASLRSNRPVLPLLEGLRQLGALADTMRSNTAAPILVKGPMNPGRIAISGEDSQPISGLLIAASFLKGPTEIFVTHPGEKPWIDLTLHWMRRLNLLVEHENHTHYLVPGHGHYKGFDLSIPGDLSSAAFPIAAALITQSTVTLHAVDMSDCQGDKKLIEVLMSMGAEIEIDKEAQTVTVYGERSQIKGTILDINDYIDAITILAVIGCYAAGTTHIVNAAIARKKESDRIHCICTELKKMGAYIEETPDGLRVSQSFLQGATLDSYNDHRIAMSLAVAALGAQGATRIAPVACVAKTFPSFAQDFSHLGASIEVLP